jgi:hypothetical protein
MLVAGILWWCMRGTYMQGHNLLHDRGSHFHAMLEIEPEFALQPFPMPCSVASHFIIEVHANTFP